jgi:hypothetical protein
MGRFIGSAANKPENGIRPQINTDKEGLALAHIGTPTMLDSLSKLGCSPNGIFAKASLNKPGLAQF